ncbi:MAG: hypothetical protein VX642_10140 [Bdellovibrionota bacterium]|nr:hypothetical protein [Bdellovibrionota bacterium]
MIKVFLVLFSLFISLNLKAEIILSGPVLREGVRQIVGQVLVATEMKDYSVEVTDLFFETGPLGYDVRLTSWDGSQLYLFADITINNKTKGRLLFILSDSDVYKQSLKHSDPQIHSANLVKYDPILGTKIYDSKNDRHNLLVLLPVGYEKENYQNIVLMPPSVESFDDYVDFQNEHSSRDY